MVPILLTNQVIAAGYENREKARWGAISPGEQMCIYACLLRDSTNDGPSICFGQCELLSKACLASTGAKAPSCYQYRACLAVPTQLALQPRWVEVKTHSRSRTHPCRHLVTPRFAKVAFYMQLFSARDPSWCIRQFYLTICALCFRSSKALQICSQRWGTCLWI